MSAATRTKLATWSPLQTITPVEIASLDSKAAAGVARTDTASGYKCMPMSVCGVCATATVTFATKVSTSGVLTFCTNSAHTVCYSLDLLQGQTLASVAVLLKPQAHAAGAPATQPKLRVYRAATAASCLGSVAYTGGASDWDGSAFELKLSPSLGNITVGSYRIHATVTNESGAHSMSGLRVLSVRANVTVDTASGTIKPDIRFWL
jgi:hypothetical protein